MSGQNNPSQNLQPLNNQGTTTQMFPQTPSQLPIPPSLSITFQNLRPAGSTPSQITQSQAFMQQNFPQQQSISQIPQQFQQQQQAQQQGWLQNKTTPEYQLHGQRLMYVNHYLRHNPSIFSNEEMEQFHRYKALKRSSYFNLGLYFMFMMVGRAQVQATAMTTGKKLAFSSARQRFVFARMLCLNLALASHLVSTYRESKLRNYLAEKYFSQITYAAGSSSLQGLDANKQQQGIQGVLQQPAQTQPATAVPPPPASSTYL